MKLRLSIIIILVFVLSGAMTGLFSRKMMDFFLWYDPEAVTGYQGWDKERYERELLLDTGLDVQAFIFGDIHVPLGGSIGQFLPSFVIAEEGEIVEGRELHSGEKFHYKKVYDNKRGHYVRRKFQGESKSGLPTEVATVLQEVIDLYRVQLRMRFRKRYGVTIDAKNLPSCKTVVTKLNSITDKISADYFATHDTQKLFEELQTASKKLQVTSRSVGKVSNFSPEHGIARDIAEAKEFQRNYVKAFAPQISARKNIRTAGIIAQAVVAIQCAKNIDVDTMSIKAAITEVANAYEIEARQLLGSTYVLDPEFMEGLKACTQAYARAFVEGRRASATEEALAVGRARLKNALRKNR